MPVDMREWLPKLVGIETSVEVRIGEGPEARTVRCTVDPDHERQLTREEATAAVHYVHFSFAPDEVEAVANGPVRLALAHAAYDHEVLLSDATRDELLADLRGA